MFGVQERINVPTTPVVVIRGAPGNRRDRRSLAGQKISTSGGSDTAAMTDLLVAVAERKDKAAFSQLFAHYAPRIKSYLMRQGANQASAEELSQEAMLSVWRKADRFDRLKAAAVSIGETQSRIRNVIATLPIEQAEVVRLLFYEDKPHGETAQEFDLPLGTVKSRLRLAMRRARTALGEEQ